MRAAGIATPQLAAADACGKMPPMKPPSPRRSTPSAKGSSLFLVNKLTVDDARHLIRTEGGELAPWQFAWELASLVAVAALTARAIWTGGATVWHLAMPLAAQYFAMLAALPALYAVVRHPAMRKDALQSLRLIVGFAVIGAGATYFRSQQNSTGWSEQLALEAYRAWRWIADAQMHWPLAAAMFGLVSGLPSRVRALLEHGPPFVAAGIGCAMRLLVLLLGLIVVPIVLEGAARPAWVLWGLLTAADLLALWMHWDVQRRLRRWDAQQAAA